MVSSVLKLAGAEILMEMDIQDGNQILVLIF